MRIHVCISVGLMMLLSASALPADEPLKIDIFAPAGAVNRHLSTPEARQKVLDKFKGLRVSKFFLEGNRADEYVPVALLREIRDNFKSKGIAASGAIGPLPGEKFGVASPLGHTRWLDYRAKKTQQDVADVFRSNAAVFDEMIVDDFYCFAEGTPEYRLDLLVRLIDTMMLKPARETNPKFRLIIKLPMWYDRFQLFGYDPAGMTAAADTIWIGTESRNRDTRLFDRVTRRAGAPYGYVMPTEGYINFRWLATVAGPKTGGVVRLDRLHGAKLPRPGLSERVGRGPRADVVQSRQLDARPPGPGAAGRRVAQAGRIGGEGPRPPGPGHFVLQALG